MAPRSCSAGSEAMALVARARISRVLGFGRARDLHLAAGFSEFFGGLFWLLDSWARSGRR
jgi:hypothetical protein